MSALKVCLPAVLGMGCLLGSLPLGAAEEEVRMSPEARKTEHSDSAFSSGPFYDNRAYDYQAQLDIYGGKSPVDTPRPLLELGRRIYDKGYFPEESYIFGDKNPVSQQFVIYGDWRNALAHNEVGNAEADLLATKLTLELDWKLTATERLHLGVTPFDKNGDISRVEIGGSQGSGDKTVIDFRPDSAFFEGDLGAIVSGFSDDYTSWDMPIALGLMPLQFQNGIWMDDAIAGVAASVISQHSKSLDISNYDITFFAGFNKVNSPLRNSVGGLSESDSQIVGIAAFLDANQGYWELDYGYTRGDGDLDDQSYHNIAIGFTRRYGSWLSNSVRVITNFGQDVASGLETADGTLYLIENSLITRNPSTFIPYFNLFLGRDRPQALARAAAAGGVLKNVGITFETDNMTGFPTLDASGNNTYGGALGIEYLFGLNRQIVVEIAAQDILDDDEASAIADRQAAVGVRFQQNLTKAWLLRMDAVYSDNKVSATDFKGARIELRRKF